MAGEGPYLESNQPYNPIPGLAAGAFIGGGMTGLGTAGVIGSINGIRGGKQNLHNQKRKQLEKSISNADGAIDRFTMESLSKDRKSYNPKNERYQSNKKDAKYLYNHRKEKQQELSNHNKTKLKAKIGGGRMAGIIGGTALAGAIIGGTAGAMGNYD